MRYLDRYDTGRDGDDRITHDHKDGSNNLPETGLRRQIAIANGGHGHNRPVNTARDTGKTVRLPLDQVHQRTDHTDDQQHGKNEDGNLPSTHSQGFQDDLTFAYIEGELQHPEYPQYAQRPHRHQVLPAGEENAQVGGQDRDQVYDPVKAEDIPPRAPDADDAYDVLDREQEGKTPFQIVN